MQQDLDFKFFQIIKAKEEPLFNQPGCPSGYNSSKCDGTQKKNKDGLVCNNCAACLKAKKKIMASIEK